MRIVIAALSARALAQAAAREGIEAIALDTFGDADTQRAARRWESIAAADAAVPSLDGTRLVAALERIARADEAQGWIAGSGFEGRPEWIEAAARVLPLLGHDAAAWRRVREPRGFFDTLDGLGIAHPPVRFDSAAIDRAGRWLVKDFASCGGTQVREAAGDVALGATQYLQQRRDGLRPMSATFVAHARGARLIGCNEQLVQGGGERPYLWCGAIGPVPLPAPVRREVERAVQSLSRAFALRGLAGLDFLYDEPTQHIEWLELNPRPTATMALYADAGVPVLRAHLQACAGDEPRVLDRENAAPRGLRIVFARTPLQLGGRALQWLAAQPDAHDLPARPTRLAQGEPVCSVSAACDDPAALRTQLDHRSAALLDALERFE